MSVSPDLLECLAAMRRGLKELIRALDGVIAVTIDHPAAVVLRQESDPIPEEMRQALPMMLQATGSSTNSLLLLSDPPGLSTRDCYSVARSILEISANLCFIMAEGPAAAERALRHARQKAFQDLERQSRIGESAIELVYQGRPDASTLDGMETDIAEFTAKSGREKGWVDESIDDRIEAAGRRFGDAVLSPLHFARFMVYRHSSEILHGTLFGALFFFGVTTPQRPDSPDKLLEAIAQQQMLLLMATILSHSAAIEAFHQSYGFARAQQVSTEVVGSLRTIPYFAKGRPNTSDDEPSNPRMQPTNATEPGSAPAPAAETDQRNEG